MMPAVPLERFHDLRDLPVAGYQTTIRAHPEELKRLAEWADVDEVSRLEANVTVTPGSKTRFHLETEFVADVVQACVVTLEPVRSHIERRFTRELYFAPGLHGFADKGGLVTPAAAEDEAPEEIESPQYDLAGPLREEFALAIDPYPRAPGAAFAASGDVDEPPESPFTVLETLKAKRS